MAHNNNKRRRVECPKCNGKGVISAFLGIDNGKCFMCAGDRWISVLPLDEVKRLQGSVLYVFSIVADHVAEGGYECNPAWIEHKAAVVVADLRALANTELARDLLRSGRRTYNLDRFVDRVIELGRQARAADQASAAQ